MPQPTSASPEAPAFAPSPPADADLSKEMDAVLERRAGETVRCVRIYGDNYRCNWWGREDVASGTHEDRNAVSIPVTTMRVKRSRFLKANKTASGLVIEDVTCQRPR